MVLLTQTLQLFNEQQATFKKYALYALFSSSSLYRSRLRSDEQIRQSENGCNYFGIVNRKRDKTKKVKVTQLILVVIDFPTDHLHNPPPLRMATKKSPLTTDVTVLFHGIVGKYSWLHFNVT